MTFLAFIQPAFTFPYLKIYYFPWVIPLPLLVEIAVFILLDPDRSAAKVIGTILVANFLGLLVGLMVAYFLQGAFDLLLGGIFMRGESFMIGLGVVLAILLIGAVKVAVWTLSFGPHLYIRRVVIVTHMLCAGVLCLLFYLIPFFGSLRMPSIPFLS